MGERLQLWLAASSRRNFPKVLTCVITHEVFSSSAWPCSEPLSTRACQEGYKSAVLLHLSTSASTNLINKQSLQLSKQHTHNPSLNFEPSNLPSTHKKMQSKTLLSVLSVAIAASARPNPVPLPHPLASASSCGAPQVAACCNSVTTNGTGLGCIFSSTSIRETLIVQSRALTNLDGLALNIIPQCTETQTLACCDTSQVGHATRLCKLQILTDFFDRRLLSLLVVSRFQSPLGCR